jgi:hypothetical protein
MANNKKNGDTGEDEKPELNEDGTPKTEYAKTEAAPIQDKSRKQKVAELRAKDSELATKTATAQEKRAQAEAEYHDLVRQAAENNARLTQAVGTPLAKPSTIGEYSKQQAQKDAPMVNVFVPKPFMHRLDDHTLLDVGSGRRSVPVALADHWWFAANGVSKMEDADA